jgi:hypothetical protein
MSVDAANKTAEQPPTSRPHEKPLGSDSDAFGPDDVFHILQNQRRRRVLEYLRDVDDDTVVMADIAEQVAAWEHDVTVDALTSTQRQRVYIALYQRHLPKLDDMDVIDYNQSRGLVKPKERAQWIADYLYLPIDDDDATDSHPRGDESAEATGPATAAEAEAGGDTDERSASYYLGASVLATLLLGLVAFDVSAFAMLSELAVAGTTVVAFLLLSIGQLRG